jgi:ABC-type multidrug transport system fused ATPase/permease subunit
VQTALDRLMQHRTTFVIAHRFSTLRNADRIMVFDRGRLVGFAPHERLLVTCQTYRELWASQGSGGDFPFERARPRAEAVDV